MIIEGVVAAIAGLLTTLIGLLPTGTPTLTLGGLATIVGYAKGLNEHLPITESLAALGFVIIYMNASILYRAGNWVYRHIPFVS